MESPSTADWLFLISAAKPVVEFTFTYPCDGKVFRHHFFESIQDLFI